MGKKIWYATILILLLIVLAQSSRAQTQTNVTATIKDPLGIPYAGGTYSIQLIPTGNNPSVNGAAIGGAFNGRLDATGSFNVSLWPNASIVPAATTWQFTICIPGGIPLPLGTGGQCTPPTAVTIAGAAQSLSATLSAVAPQLTTISFGGGGTIAGTIAVNQVAVGTALNTIGGNPDFIFTDVAGVQFLQFNAGVQGNFNIQVSQSITHLIGPTAAGSDHLDITIHGQQMFNASCSNCTTDQVVILLPGTGAQATFTPGNLTMGSDGTTAGTLQLANAAASAHTIWGSAATVSNTILGFATVPVTGHIVTCTTVGTVCTLTDGGAAGGIPTLDQVLNPVASKTFTLGANSLTFTGTAGITLTNTGGSQVVSMQNTAASGAVTIENNTGATGGVVNVANFNSTGSVNITDVRGLGITIAAESSTQGLITLTIDQVANTPQIILNTSGITLTNAKPGGTLIEDSGGGGVTVKDSATGHGNALLYSVHSTGTDLGAYVEDDGTVGVTLDSSNGTGAVMFLANTTGGLKVKSGGGALTSGVTAGPFSTVSSIQTIDGIVTTLTGTSDARLKMDIVPFARGLDAILAISPKLYRWNAAGQKITGFAADQQFAGFIAQDVQAAIPEAIGREGEYLSLDTRAILAALVNAVKELAMENSRLRDRVAVLDAKR